MEISGSSGPVVAEDNIINRRGGESLYQSCTNLKKRLSEVPGFEPFLAEILEMESKEGDNDPVDSVWRCLQTGYPLMAIFNASNPRDLLMIDETKVAENKRPKAATFKFLQACLSELHFPQQECFLVTDLYGENTTGFVKVIKMVNRVLDMLESQGQLYNRSTETTTTPQNGGRKLSRREHILKEMIETERDYVLHLQNLEALRKELEETGAVSGDTSHQIFRNLSSLLDFCQRFLISMEQHYARPEEKQNWGELYKSHHGGFQEEYEPFIANQMRCDALCLKEWDRIRVAPRSVDLQQMVAQLATLNSFFVKPFQRLTKYPLMLTELRKITTDQFLHDELVGAINSIQEVLDRANIAVDKEHLVTAVTDLASRVDDWKSHKVETFGELLRFGTFTVIKGDGGKDAEREYHVYLFETILLLCKDMPANRQKSKLMSKEKSHAASKGKPRLQLKGRIYMQNLTEIVAIQKPGVYKVQIFWKGDPEVVDNFTIRFQNEDMLRKWYKDLDHQREIHREQRTLKAYPTSETEFTYLQNVPKISNPYQQDYEEEELSRETSLFSDFSMSRTTSSTSLRTRSATNGSGGSNRTRVPVDNLHIQTANGGTMSPGERGGNSYFSPTEPQSTRSSQSTMLSYGRPGLPSGNWNEDPSNRYTAPAMSRVPSRDGTSPQYYNPTRAQRPSLPTYPYQYSQSGQARLRSASSPDFHNQANGKYPPGHSHMMQTVDNVPVPPIPAHMAGMRAPVNRSQNNSPTNSVQSGLRSGGGPTSPYRPPVATASPYPDMTHYGYPQYTPGIMPQSSFSSAVTQDEDPPMPTQLKARVNFDNNYVTLVVASNILFRSLTDRVDAKLARFTDRSIGNNSVRLRYQDEDGDFITIDSDEAVQLAFMEWRDQHQDMLASGQVGEIQLFCQAI